MTALLSDSFGEEKEKQRSKHVNTHAERERERERQTDRQTDRHAFMAVNQSPYRDRHKYRTLAINHSASTTKSDEAPRITLAGPIICANEIMRRLYVLSVCLCVCV